MNEPTKPDQDLAGPGTGAASPNSSANSAPGASAQSSEGEAGYRLAESEAVAVSPPSVSPPPAPQQNAGATPSTFQPATEEGEPEPLVESFPDEPPAVDEVWSRWAEWKEPLLWSGGGIVFAVLIVFGGFWVATAVFVLASAYGAYHIIISLEVPVRVTPEQVVREFYGAAAHRLPNFRRMYALLTADGRQRDEFSDFSDFRAYWQAAVARLSGTHTWLVPLEFRIEGFRCRYNGDKTLASVRYILKVSPRGRPESDEPTAEFQLRNLAVKGPDGQWYLNDGTLPDPS